MRSAAVGIVHVGIGSLAGGTRVAMDVARKVSRRSFDVTLAGNLAGRKDRAFWKALRVGDVSTLLAIPPAAGAAVHAEEDELDRVAEAFAAVIDAKSPFTHDHSHRVSALAVGIGERLGIRGRGLVRLRRAALLHDIGKLGVPNRILDKPGPLTAAEWKVVRRHPRLTFEILDRVPSFREFAYDASCHHEKLDGSGYFRQLSGSAISQTARILAVADIVDALLAERPYRPGLPAERVVEMLRADRGRALSADCVDAAIQGLERS